MDEPDLMSCIVNHVDPVHHPHLYSISQGARWVGKDDFPACSEWADEIEKWLRFIRDHKVDGMKVWGNFFLPRLRDHAPKRDEALSEIAVAYFLEARCGFPVKAWEPEGSVGKKGEPLKGEFLVEFQPSGQIFVEVKSPGWEQEVVTTQGPASPRLRQPKHLDGEGGPTDPVAPVRGAVAKAYPKLPDSMPTLLVITDDLKVALNAWPDTVEIALYCERAEGYTNGYLAEDGCFVGCRYERLGAVGILNVELKGVFMEYRFTLFRNPNCLGSVALPQELFADYPAYEGLT